MAAIPQLEQLTLDAFDGLYGDRKPYHEFWFGEAIQKAMPNSFHALLQYILAKLLAEIGLIPSVEVRLKISSDAELLPDVIGVSRIQHPYPTKPFEVAAEILSPSDSAQYLFRKCRLYSQWGIQHIFVLDPEDRTAQEWNHQRQGLEAVAELRVAGRAPIAVSRIWDESQALLEQGAEV